MDNEETVRNLAGGTFMEDLGKEITDQALLAANLGRKASVTVTISIEPKGALVLVTSEITSKPPKGDKQPAMFFVGTDSLHHSDPRQATLDGLLVDDVLSEARNVTDERREGRRVE